MTEEQVNTAQLISLML